MNNLGPYNRAMSQIGSRIEMLDSIATPEMRERGGPSELRAFTVSKLDNMRETLRLYREEGQSAALAQLRTDRGRSDMDGIRGRGPANAARGRGRA